MTPEQVDAYFAQVGLPKPTIEEFFAGLEAAGFRFSIEVGGLFIGFPLPDDERPDGAVNDALVRYPLSMFTGDQMAAFLRQREGAR